MPTLSTSYKHAKSPHYCELKAGMRIPTVKNFGIPKYSIVDIDIRIV